MSWPRYEPATYNSGGASPGAQALMDVFVQDYGARNLGIYNWRTVRGPSAAISLHGEGRGVDLGYTNKAKGDAALALLLQHRMALGVQLNIWWRRIYSAKAPNGATYQGVVPHTDHIHVELNRHAGKTLTPAYIRSVLRGGRPPIYVPPAAAKPPLPVSLPFQLEDSMLFTINDKAFGTRTVIIEGERMADFGAHAAPSGLPNIPLTPEQLAKLRSLFPKRVDG